ncbi:MAG: hydroxymethylbilane synthase, partial [Wenzhouxiangellaceae bacterium]
ALWQSEHVAERLREYEITAGLLPLSTRGDEILDRSLAEIGGKGLFLKELEVALLDGRADIAVHSLKDVPAEQPDGLMLAAWLPRANPADLWITADGTAIRQLPKGSRVGSSSLRRISQLKALRPDLEVVALRGNVETRLAAVREGRVAATLLAAAGLERLGIVPPGAIELAVEDWLPAPGQGIIVVQCRADDSDTISVLESLSCPLTTVQARAEREVARLLGADCSMPLAAFAHVSARDMCLRVRLGDGAGRLIEAQAGGSITEPEDLARKAVKNLRDQGAEVLLEKFSPSQN